MLLTRVATAVVGIPLVLYLIFLGGWFLTVPVCVLAALAIGEFADKCRAKCIEVLAPAAGLAALVLVCAAEIRSNPGTEALLGPGGFANVVLLVLFGLVAGTLIYNVVRYHHDQKTPVLQDASATILAGAYAGIPFAFFPLLRGMDIRTLIGGDVLWPSLEPGGRLILLVFCCTWATDSAAYFVGRSLGKNKLTPASPNKTVEGFVGGFVGCALIALLLGAWLGLPLHFTLPLGVVLGFAGQFGDLAKSILKRDLGTKDFGSLLPGHGGVLDRFDSLMLNVPLAYALALLLV